MSSFLCNRFIDLVVKASTSRAEEHGFESRLRQDFFGVELYLDSSGYPARRLAFIGSALELVGPVSAYCDWVR